MENDEKALNPQESLRVIRETIDLAKSGVRENGFHFLLWGWLVVLASLAEYCLLLNGAGVQAHMVWMLLPLIGVPAALIYERRRSKAEKARNIVREWHGYIWLGFGISLILGLVVMIRSQVSPVPMVLILTGFATFLSGILLRFRPLILGGIAIWVSAILCFFVPTREHSLVEAGALILGYLIPGYLLNQKAQSSYV